MHLDTPIAKGNSHSLPLIASLRLTACLTVISARCFNMENAYCLILFMMLYQ